jgi:hypothetical protein
MKNERSYDDIEKDIIQGGRTQEEIVSDILPSAGVEEKTRKAILEVLLDIRDLLKNK